MMNVEKLKQLVDKSDLPNLQKVVTNGFIDRAKEAEEIKRENRQLIEQVARILNVSEVVFANDDVMIYTVNGKDEWNVKYPFRSIYLTKDGAWRQNNTNSPTFDLAFLVYLQYKHLGLNSQFVDFAMKMLEIPIENEK